MKNLTLLFTFLVTSLNIFGQDTYVRPSVSVININYNNQKSELDLNSVKVPSSLDYLKLSKTSFKSNTNSPKISDNEIESKEKIESRKKINLSSFIDQKVSNAAILAVVPIKNGEYDYSNLDNRGVNSATDQDVNITSQNMFKKESDRYSYITDKLLNKNYVIAFNMSRFKSYNSKSTEGFEGSISYIAFKIENIYNSESAELSIAAKDINSSEIKASIVTEGKIKLTKTRSKEKIIGIKQKTDSELKRDLNNELVQSVWSSLNREIDDFQPRTTLLKKRRIALGSKENLKVDNRFFVYENIQNENGEVVKKKKATMRVKRVAKNEGKATGDSEKSKLYKIGYGSAKEGMLVQQKEDVGLGLSLGYGTLSWLRADFRIKGITPGLLAFVDVHPYPGSVEFDKTEFIRQGAVYQILEGFSSANFSRGDFSATAINAYAGIEKQIRLGSALYLSPFVGAGYSSITLSGDVMTISYFGGSESYTWDDEENSIFDAYLAKAGARFGIQLTHALSANFTLSYVYQILGGWSDPSFEGIYNLGFYSQETNQKVLEDYYESVIEDMPDVPKGIETTIMLRYEL